MSVRFNLSADSLRRCFREHTTFSQEESIIQEIKQLEKSLPKVLKEHGEGTPPAKNIRVHIKSLREELRTLDKIRRETAPELLQSGEQPLTVAALDQILREYKPSEKDGKEQARVAAINNRLVFEVKRGDRLALCDEIDKLITAWMQKPLLQPRQLTKAN